MNLEQAILDRLEKRNAQIAQLQSTVHALERAADSQREHAMMERGRLLEEKKKQADRIERMEESAASADMLRKSMNDEITKRDRELREMDAEAKAYREAIQKKDTEIQEWLMQLATARNERDAAITRADNIATPAVTDAVDIAHAYGQKPYESLGGFIGRVCMEREELKAEQLRLNAKVGPLEKLYEVVKKHVDHGAIIDNRADIYDEGGQ